MGHITKKVLNHSYYDLTERAKIDLDFLLLTVAAAAICALGFKMNSAPVIVGAMVISPLLYPVICAGAATYQADWGAFIRLSGPLQWALLPLLLLLSLLVFFPRRRSGRRSSID